MKQRVRTLLVSVAILLGLCICVASGLPRGLSFFVNRWSAYPAWSPDGERIAYTCHYPTLSQVWEDKGSSLFNWGCISEGWEICTIKPNGRGFVRLTRNQNLDSNPVWSPDGQWIAYVSGGALQVLQADGSQSQPRSLEVGQDIHYWEELSWSPDGKHLCFTAENKLYVATLEDGTIQALTTLPGAELDAAWSPDGTRISFTRQSAGKGVTSEHGDTIWIADMKGRLESVDLIVPEFDEISQPSWGPDGTHLAFWGLRYDGFDTYTEVYILDLESGQLKCLTEAYELRITEWDWSAWIPAEDRIAFTARGVLYTILSDGSDLIRIASLPQSSYGFVLSPDGKYLTFERGIEGDKTRIWLVEMENGSVRELRTP